MFPGIKPAAWLSLFVLFLTLQGLGPAKGQILEFDQNPPQIRWRQIHTERFRLIYPAGFEARAWPLSRQLDSLSRLAATGLGITPKKTPVILQNQSVMSNGFVQLAPRRSEFVTTPPRQGETRDWMGNLSIHELRHIAQFDLLVGNFRRPLLEQGGLALFGLHLPSWFFEGDAVWVETHLSRGGRGDIPSWNMPLRANLLSGKQYSYQKNYLGSYKDVTPDFYALGYFMVEKLYREQGVETAGSLMKHVSRNLLHPYSFSQALKKQTGHSTKQWHRHSTEELLAIWEKQEQNRGGFREYPAYPVPDDRFPIDWLLPQAGPEGTVLVLRRGARFVPAIMELDPNGSAPRSLVKIGWQMEPHFSAVGSRIVWDEIRRNPRYAKQTFSVINTYDLNTGKTRQLTRRSRLFSPVLSPDGGRIACIEVSENNDVAVVLLDWDDGAEQGRFPVPDGLMLQTPAFDPSGNQLVAVAVSERGTSLVGLDLGTAAGFYQLIAWQDQQLERPVYQGRYILFKAHFDGIDNLYAIERDSISPPEGIPVRQLTHARFGAFNPSADPKTGDLFFNQYTPEGFRIARIGALQELPAAAKLLSAVTPLGKHILDPEPGVTNNLTAYFPPGPDKPADSTMGSKPYRERSHLFNIHSLSVTSGDFSSLEGFNPGIYLLSDNLLNTMQTRIGYVYDGELQASEYHAGMTYQRFFPKLSINYQNRPKLASTNALPTTAGKEHTGPQQSTPHQTAPAQTLMRWRENHLSMNISIPLLFYKYNYIYSTQFSIGTYITRRYGLSVSDPKALSGRSFVADIRFPMTYSLSFGRSTRRSLLDQAPRWGQHFSFRYRHFNADHINKGKTSRHIALSSLFYFPGIQQNHSLIIRASYQKANGLYDGAYDIHMVSGYDHVLSQFGAQSRKLTVSNTLLTAYRFPVAYPDWEIGPLAYIKRIKGGFFADFQNLSPHNQQSIRPLTVGMELRADLHFLRFPLPLFDAGAKLIYINDRSIPDKWIVTYGFSYSY